MLHCRSISELREALAGVRRDGRRIALVPTMGALHEGHLSLFDLARNHADFVVASVFVNPLQFAAGEDLDNYPRDIDRDAALAAGRGVDLLFAPPVDEVYPSGHQGTVVSPGRAAESFEGSVRRGHFEGVVTVVAKLLNMVAPHVACFGQKDLQQFAVLSAMARDLDFPTELVRGPTVRDVDGLALSSRNAYLSSVERESALAIPRALDAVEKAWRGGERSAGTLVEVARQFLSSAGVAAVDYIAVVDPGDFGILEDAREGAALVVAVRVGRTRLLDNLILREEDV